MSYGKNVVYDRSKKKYRDKASVFSQIKQNEIDCTTFQSYWEYEWIFQLILGKKEWYV